MVFFSLSAVLFLFSLLSSSSSVICFSTIRHTLFSSSSLDHHNIPPAKNNKKFIFSALSDAFLENDLVAVRIRIDDNKKKKDQSSSKDPNADDDDDYDTINNNNNNNKDENEFSIKSRLCVVRSDGGVYALCVRADDVETDFFIDPRVSSSSGASGAASWLDDLTDDDVISTYGEGWYGQRPVPSLGGGPGYASTADEIWSVDVDVLDMIQRDGVLIPILDVGIAHGAKARGGFY